MVKDYSFQCQRFEDAYARTPRKRLLGRGAFGSVFAVTPADDPTRRYVAKEIQVGQLTRRQQETALAEVQLLRSLSHPHIIGCVDTLLVHSTLYIVMEYATGGDLSQKIKAQRDVGEHLPERSVMVPFAQLSAALHFVHSRKILHRDLKPANVFVCGSGDLASSTCKLGDFGLGKMFEGTTFEAMSMVGSPSYFSPEVCDGKPYGRKSDVWSLGAVLHELACLEVPFVARTLLAVAMMICKTEAKALPSEYSQDMRDLAARLLKKSAAERPNMKVVCQDPYVNQFLPAQPESSEPLAGSQSMPETVSSVDPESRECSRDLPGGIPAPAKEDTRAFADAIEAAIKQHDFGKQGMMPREVLKQLLPLVLPGLSKDAVAGVLQAANCEGEFVEIRTFLDWLCQ